MIVTGCKPGVLDDLELHYRLLEELVYRLDMVPMTTPYVIHGPVKYSDEVNPTKDGLVKEVKREELYPQIAGVSRLDSAS